MDANLPDTQDAPIIARELKKERWKVAATYAVLGMENAAYLIYPLLIGIAINGVLAGDLYSLAPLAAVWFVHILIAAARQIYDTMLFSRIYAAIALGLSQRQRAQNNDVSQLSAHVEMARDVVDFYEFHVPDIASVIIALVGAAALMFLYDPIAGLMVSALLLPAGLINAWLAGRSVRLNKVMNAQHERQVDALRHGGPLRIATHFARLRRFRIGLSNAEAFSWSALEVLTMLVSLAVIVQLANVDGASAGSIFAGVAYLLRIIDQLDRVPEAIQQIARLVEIRRRLRG